MFDCSTDVRAYHDQEVNLPVKERESMRERRNANRRRVRNGLDDKEKPTPIEFVKQGSYAMKTMVQAPDNDYDIDDGVYFDQVDLVGERGAELTSLQARQMVRDAVDDGSFKQVPEVRSNCVRVFYQEGYHVDQPVYRRVVTSGLFGDEVHYELASSKGWIRSDARHVSDWYEEKRRESPDGYQLLRINRHLKKYARSRQSWRAGILSGFGISALAVECFRTGDREDIALYDNIVAIRDRLVWNLEIAHPVTPGDYITDSFEDTRARLFRDKLNDAINWLQPLFSSDCEREQALKCWDKVFATTFFSERQETQGEAAEASVVSSAAIILSTSRARGAVNGDGGGRHA